ncbi:MAG: MarR family transcriptional regulator [Mariniphaga sp.]|nr:MarR family transcriptional regulator [Mariniphaga sp.]
MYDFDKSLGKITGLVSRAIGHRLEEKLAQHGIKLTAAQWSIISLLHKKTDQTQKDIAVFLELDKVMVKRLIDQLEKTGLLTRRVSHTDRRANYVNLTESGIALYHIVSSDAEEALNVAYKNITENEHNQVFSVLERIYSNLKREQ